MAEWYHDNAECGMQNVRGGAVGATSPFDSAFRVPHSAFFLWNGDAPRIFGWWRRWGRGRRRRWQRIDHEQRRAALPMTRGGDCRGAAREGTQDDRLPEGSLAARHGRIRHAPL